MIRYLAIPEPGRAYLVVDSLPAGDVTVVSLPSRTVLDLGGFRALPDTSDWVADLPELPPASDDRADIIVAERKELAHQTVPILRQAEMSRRHQRAFRHLNPP